MCIRDSLKVCPECGSEDIDTIQRITGYLVGTTSRWNNGKLAELKDRVTHINGEDGMKIKGCLLYTSYVIWQK